jgi:hypothetical protein
MPESSMTADVSMQPEIFDEFRIVEATPYTWVDPLQIEPRSWLYSRHFIRRFVSATVASGGVGKSSLLIAEMLAMVTGRDLLKCGHRGPPLRVWYWNLEDPPDEIIRRVQAAAKFYGLGPEDLGSRLFVNSGRNQACNIANISENGIEIDRGLVDAILQEIDLLAIDVLVIDPFVSAHGVPENDNSSIDKVAKEFVRIADAGNCSVELLHHTRKQGAEQITSESARGAKALVEASRSVRVLNRMTSDEAAKAGITDHRRVFRVFSDKSNLAPPLEKSDWYRLESVDLGQGDHVGVVTPWAFPDPMGGIKVEDLLAVQRVVSEGNYRRDHQSPDWVGNAVAKTLGLNLQNPADRSKVMLMIKTWLASGALVEVEKDDGRRRSRIFVEVGQCAT